MTTRIDLAAALRAGGPALIAEAIASLRSVVLELNDNSACSMVMRTDEKWLQDLQARVAALPPGNARLEEKRPPPPDELVGALHDPIHPPSGNLIASTPVEPPKPTALEDLQRVEGATGVPFLDAQMDAHRERDQLRAECQRLQEELAGEKARHRYVETESYAIRCEVEKERDDFRKAYQLKVTYFNDLQEERDTLAARVAELEQLSGMIDAEHELNEELIRKIETEKAAHEVTKRELEEANRLGESLISRPVYESLSLRCSKAEREIAGMRAVVDAAQRLIDADSIDQSALLSELDLKLSALSQPSKPHPQSRYEQKRPPPPEELVGALHDPIHEPSGDLIKSRPARTSKPAPAPVAAGEREIVEGDSVLCDFTNGTQQLAIVVRIDSSSIPYLVEYEKMEPVKHQTWMDARSIRLAPSGNPSTPAAETGEEET